MASNKRRRAVVLLNVLVGLAGLQLSGAFVLRALPIVRRTVSQAPAPLLAPPSAKKADTSDGEPKKPRARSSSKKAEDKEGAPVKKTTKKTTEAASTPASPSASAVATPPKPRAAKKSGAPRGKPEGPLFDAALVGSERAVEMYEGDEVFNIIKQGEDVVAPWSVGGFEIDLPDWRPQPAEKYEIVDPSIHDRIDKIYHMFGSQVKLVSTKDGIFRFFYWGEIRNLIGAEAWAKLVLVEDLGLEEVKKVRFETSYVRDFPDDYN